MSNKFTLIWNNGGYIVGEDWIIARKYFKKKRMTLGLLKLNGHNKLIYSYKRSGSLESWKPCDTIKDTGDYDRNRKLAFRDFFYSVLMNTKGEFSIIKLADNHN